jgi:hypothetical protein
MINSASEIKSLRIGVTICPHQKETELILAGGLGNQLFRFIAGLNFSSFTSTKLVLNTSWYSSNRNGRNGLTFRKPDLLNFENIKLKYEIRTNCFPNMFLTQFSILNRLRLKRMTIGHADFPYLRLNKNYLFESFESVDYFPKFINFDNLFDFPIDSPHEINTYHATIDELEPIIVHLRAGDHLLFPHIYRILEPEYFVKSIDLIKSRYGDRPIWLLSDDLEYSVNYLKGVQFDDFLNFSSLVDAVQVLKLCSKARFFIGCESNLSWWIYYFSINNEYLIQAVLPKGTYFSQICGNSSLNRLEFS